MVNESQTWVGAYRGKRPSTRARGPALAEQTTTPYQPENETWASGIAQFGAAMMIIVGAFQAATGVVALVGDEFFVATRSYVFQLDTTTWGWIHVVVFTA